MFKDDLLAGKRILITGGGTGLGKAMTERYVELGAHVIICGRRKNVLDDTAEEITQKMQRTNKPGSISTYAIDIRNPEAIEDMVNTIWADGPLHGLVNNAAGNFISRTEDLSPGGFNAITDIVMRGAFYLTDAIGKRWLNEGLKGNIINILVSWIWTGGPFVVPSAMAKSGVAAMTKSLAVEWGNRGIRVNAIVPGNFPTQGASARLLPGQDLDSIKTMSMGIPMGRAGEMPELANLAVFLMADGVDYLTGEIIAIDGGQWLAGGGTFAQLSNMSDEQWTMIRQQIKSANEKDKADRSV